MKFWKSLLNKKKYPVILQPSGHNISGSSIDRSIRDILMRLRRNGYQAYLVGGCVRDLLLNRSPKDFDIVTDARPRQIKRLFKRCYIIGRRFRLAHVYIDRENFIEVSTFRALNPAPPSTDSKGRVLSGENQFGTIDEDAQRRDFTVNALYYDLLNSTITDYTGGLEDLKKRIIRSIGKPEVRFTEDPVRMIRLARFAASFKLKISSSDYKAAVKNAHLIKEANSNRLIEELYKILQCGASAGTIEILRETGVLNHWIPELADKKENPRLGARLEAVDIMRASGSQLSRTLLLTNLFFDLFYSHLKERTETLHGALEIMNSEYRDFVTRMKIPWKEWHIAANNSARQLILENPEKAEKRKKFIKKFTTNAYFDEAVGLLGIRAESGEGFKDELKFWKDLVKKPRKPSGSRKPSSRRRSPSEKEK